MPAARFESLVKELPGRLLFPKYAIGPARHRVQERVHGVRRALEQQIDLPADIHARSIRRLDAHQIHWLHMLDIQRTGVGQRPLQERVKPEGQYLFLVRFFQRLKLQPRVEGFEQTVERRLGCHQLVLRRLECRLGSRQLCLEYDAFLFEFLVRNRVSHKLLVSCNHHLQLGRRLDQLALHVLQLGQPGRLLLSTPRQLDVGFLESLHIHHAVLGLFSVLHEITLDGRAVLLVHLQLQVPILADHLVQTRLRQHQVHERILSRKLALAQGFRKPRGVPAPRLKLCRLGQRLVQTLLEINGSPHLPLDRLILGHDPIILLLQRVALVLQFHHPFPQLELGGGGGGARANRQQEDREDTGQQRASAAV
mmetsp:Transcript_9431/g.25574  ORF Transcript_9431/g.25574 Transcript_9431/m.25574 type:complete len:366 (+) Transcript_9431:1005-2102(+)